MQQCMRDAYAARAIGRRRAGNLPARLVTEPARQVNAEVWLLADNFWHCP
jgi:hypothetical protein